MKRKLQRAQGWRKVSQKTVGKVKREKRDESVPLIAKARGPPAKNCQWIVALGRKPIPTGKSNTILALADRVHGLSGRVAAPAERPDEPYRVVLTWWWCWQPRYFHFSQPPAKRPDEPDRVVLTWWWWWWCWQPRSFHFCQTAETEQVPERCRRVVDVCGCASAGWFFEMLERPKHVLDQRSRSWMCFGWLCARGV
jgi:hypothetical protein